MLRRFGGGIRKAEHHRGANQSDGQKETAAGAPAQILDVNVGAPGVDEVALMPKVIQAVQSVTDIPLQLDSVDPEVLRAGLRVVNGRPIVNSVNGERERLDSVLPLVADYGTAEFRWRSEFSGKQIDMGFRGKTLLWIV